MQLLHGTGHILQVLSVLRIYRILRILRILNALQKLEVVWMGGMVAIAHAIHPVRSIGRIALHVTLMVGRQVTGRTLHRTVQQKCGRRWQTFRRHVHILMLQQIL